MASSVSLKASGLFTSNSPLLAPEGALQEATNVIIRRDGIVESRRGYKQIDFNAETTGSSVNPIMNLPPSQILFYKDRLIRHVDNKLQHVDSNGNVYDFNNGSITSDRRIKYVEDMGNLLFTSNDGIKKISLKSSSDYQTIPSTVKNEIFNAGAPKGVSPAAEIVYTYGSINGILPIDSACSYKVVWGYNDNNNKLILGSPSDSYTVFNNYSYILYNDYMRMLLSVCNTISIPTSIYNNTVNYSNKTVAYDSTTSDFYNQMVDLCETIDSDFKYNSLDDTTGFTLHIGTETYTVENVGGIFYVYINSSLVSPEPIVWSDHFQKQDKIEILAPTNNTQGFNLTGKYKVIDMYSNTTDNILKLEAIKDYSLEVLTTKTEFALNELFTSYDFRALDPVILESELGTPSYQTYIKLQEYLISIRELVQRKLEMYLTPESFNTNINFLKNTYYSEVSVDIPIPNEIINYKSIPYFVQVYRTNIVENVTVSVTNLTQPSDNYYLVFEHYPSDDEYLNGIVNFKDNIPDNLKTTPLYTNINDGEGINQTNDRPPISHDIVSFKDYVFYSDVSPKSFAKLQILGVDYLLNGSDIPNLIINGREYSFTIGANKRYKLNVVAAVQGTSYIQVKGDINVYRFCFIENDAELPLSTTEYITIPVYNTLSNTQEFVNSLQTLPYDFTNIAIDGSDVVFENNKEGVIGYPIIVSAEIDVIEEIEGSGENGDNNFLVSNNYSPAKAIELTTKSLVRVINKDPLSTVVAYDSSTNLDLPGLIYFQSKNYQENITITWNVPNNSNILTDASKDYYKVFQPEISQGYDYITEPEVNKNLIYYSKFQQGEAVPESNNLVVGAKDKAIVKIAKLRESLFIFKEDGVYRLSGIAPFTVELFDSTMVLLAPDSVAAVNNFLFGWAQQGVFVMSESSSKIISKPIDNLVLPLYPAYLQDFVNKTFAIGYESDNSYLVFTQNILNDGELIGYRYSTLFDSWTVFDIQATCGVIYNKTDLMYLGSETKEILVERKKYDRSDYVGREYKLDLTANSFEQDNKIFIGQTNFININPILGDVFTQIQEVTNNQYNDLLETLDDLPLFYSSYLADLNVVSKNIMSDNLESLRLLLNLNEVGVGKSFTTDFVFTGLTGDKAKFDYIVTRFNETFDLNITKAVSAIFECMIVSSDSVGYTFTLESNDDLKLQQSEYIIHKGISCSIVYSPQHMGDPLSLKHFRETTLMLEHRRLHGVTLSYSSDLMPVYKDITCKLNGYRAFGMGSFGEGYFGGYGNMSPIRTFIPRDAQRCRYINVAFSHYGAMEQWGVIGITLTGDISSTKAYR